VGEGKRKEVQGVFGETKEKCVLNRKCNIRLKEGIRKKLNEARNGQRAWSQVARGVRLSYNTKKSKNFLRGWGESTKKTGLFVPGRAESEKTVKNIVGIQKSFSRVRSGLKKKTKEKKGG